VEFPQSCGIGIWRLSAKNTKQSEKNIRGVLNNKGIFAEKYD
jgi:hypothetical protein